jgi:hypothetical protein
MRKIQLRLVDKVVIRIHSSWHTSTLTAPQSSKAFCSFGTTKTSHTFALFHMQSRDLRGAREGSGRAGGKGNSGDRELHLSQRRQQKMWGFDVATRSAHPNFWMTYACSLPLFWTVHPSSCVCYSYDECKNARYDGQTHTTFKEWLTNTYERRAKTRDDDGRHITPHGGMFFAFCCCLQLWWGAKLGITMRKWNCTDNYLFTSIYPTEHIETTVTQLQSLYRSTIVSNSTKSPSTRSIYGPVWLYVSKERIRHSISLFITK